jgi:hypothetical protein
MVPLISGHNALQPQERAAMRAENSAALPAALLADRAQEDLAAAIPTAALLRARRPVPTAMALLLFAVVEGEGERDESQTIKKLNARSKLNLPSYSAQASLYGSNVHYQSAYVRGMSEASDWNLSR